MPKRPSLSSHLRVVSETKPDETNTAESIDASRSRTMADETRTSLTSPMLQQDIDAKTSAKDTLAGIIGDTLVTLSLASAVGWTQALRLHYRLSSYMLGDPSRPFGPT